MNNGTQNPAAHAGRELQEEIRRDSAATHSELRESVVETAWLDASGRTPVLVGFAFAMFWLLEGSVLGDIASFKLHWPDLLSQPDVATFGRLRPAHLNAMIYGWASSAMFSVALWMMPRLCRTPLQWPRMALAGIVIWNAGVVVGLVLLLAGFTDGMEWLEYDRRRADPLLVLGALLVGWSVWGTLLARRVHHLYVSVWYVAASFPWFAIIFVVGNLPWRGVESAAANWFYAHNALGLWLTTINLGLIYYLLPKC